VGDGDVVEESEAMEEGDSVEESDVVEDADTVEEVVACRVEFLVSEWSVVEVSEECTRTGDQRQPDESDAVEPPEEAGDVLELDILRPLPRAKLTVWRRSGTRSQRQLCLVSRDSWMWPK
jgi:hypothetical protein